MGILSNIREGIFKVRVIPRQTAQDRVSHTNPKDDITNKIDEAIEAGKRIDLSDLTSMTALKGDRETKYKIFEEMVADGRVGAAVEMYANDTVQYNQEGKIIWIESDNAEVAKYANKLISDLNIAENLWSYAYSMWLYGDVYLETFQNTSTTDNKPTLLLEPIKQNLSIKKQVPIKGVKLERYIEKVPNPADLYDLQYKGKTAGFVRQEGEIISSKVNQTYLYSGMSADINILSPTKFVHICLSPNINRFPERFKLIKDDIRNKVNENGIIDGSSVEGAGGDLAFQVKTGQSILENVYGPYQTLKLKEDSVLLERITKSSITRIIQVELGDLPESQKRRKLQEIKNQIEQQLIINKEAGSMQSRAGSQPLENIIYTTTKNGKGAITSVNIGGEADVGNLEDINQAENKVYGSLLVPKATLGADMEGTGLSNGGSLTELNTTYARRIKRGQVAICTGIKNLINIYALNDGLGESVVGNFEVRLTPIVTVEDNRRDELLKTKIQNVQDIIGLLENIEAIDEGTKLDMIIKWLSNYLNQQDIVDIIDERLKEIDAAESDEESDKFQDKVDDALGADEDEKYNEEEESENPPPAFNSQKPKEVDLTDIEGEDLV